MNYKKGEPWYRTATTAYPCYLPVLGEFSGSWSYQTHRLQKYTILLALPNKRTGKDVIFDKMGLPTKHC